MMSRRTIILVVLVVMLVLAGLAWFSFFPKGLDLRRLINIPGKVSDTTGDANQQRSSAELKFIDNLTDQEISILKQEDNYSVLSKHQIRCNILEDAAQKEDCLANLELSQVIRVDRPELCAQIAKKDDCYITFADLKKEADWCKKITDEDRKQACWELTKYSGDFLANSLADCQAIQNQYLMGTCIYNFILTQDDPTLCEDKIFAVNGKDSINACKDDLYFSRALKNQDQGICNQIIEITKRNNCLSALGVKVTP